MTKITMVGDENGIALWNLMASTNDRFEKEYFTNLNKAASKFGSVWFTDFVTQRKDRRNQTVWHLAWSGEQWKVSCFHVPEGVEKVSARIKGEEELVELDIDDLIMIED
jgi:hypothetical protein